jgi:hypothetical protein
MGILKLFAKSAPVIRKLPAGSFTVDCQGNVMTTTVGSEYPQWLLDDTAREVLSLFRDARAARMPLTGLDLNFAGLHITAREMQGGAIVFLSPQNTFTAPIASQEGASTSARRPGQLIARIESHIGCWKQFNYFVNLARAKKFGPEDESNFLELKKIIELDAETIFAAIEVPSPAREETIALLARASSLCHLSQMDGGDLPGLENAWHKLYTSWHTILGQIKIQRRDGANSLFGRKK